MSDGCGEAFAGEGAPEACGQREVSGDSAGAAGAPAPGLMFAAAGAGAAGGAETVACGSGQTKAAGGALPGSSAGAFGVNSARASASDRAGASAVVEGAGFAAATGSALGVRADVSSSSRRYQQWRPVPRSMR
jgi:hypothetical protein